MTTTTTSLTPFNLVNGRYYKRDDLHTGGGGTNGGKLRSCQVMVGDMLADGATAIITAASVHSPQHAIVANVCAAAGIPSYHVVGGTKPAAAMRWPTVSSAVAAGGRMHYARAGYNSVIQHAAARLAGMVRGAQVLPFGIAPPAGAPASAILRMARATGGQVNGLPADVRTLVVPVGSGNSAIGIAEGLARTGRHDVRMVLVEVGPTRQQWVTQRAAAAGIALPALTWVNLEALGFAKYHDKMPETVDGVALHPTYEGKVVRYLNTVKPAWWTDRDGTTCLWIVGGALLV
ncbi:carboxylate deaminase [Mycobacterium phage Vincenzo]|uniref:Nucleoside deaminase n=2 Tax=Coopervirus vincenzo TaxID=1983110 RepID=A0A0F6YQ47_9CAUD|nr:carboxylate deaminase [Mycobacterium phage Vincenzo]AKF14264.1 nucleoside deaminase [Mycobacterium phage Vincenzo]AKF14667.1 nucleoside deaminase [Mycobacterium phage AlanGrant]